MSTDTPTPTFWHRGLDAVLELCRRFDFVREQLRRWRSSRVERNEIFEFARTYGLTEDEVTFLIDIYLICGGLEKWGSEYHLGGDPPSPEYLQKRIQQAEDAQKRCPHCGGAL